MIRTNTSTLVVIAILLFSIAPKLSAQIIPGKIIVYGASLYNEDGEKLNEEQIKDLSSFGFDYQKYTQLKKLRTVSIVSYYIGGVLIGAGGFIGRKGDKATEFFSLSLAGSALGIFGILKQSQCEKQIVKMVEDMSDSPKLSLSTSGLGLVYYF